MREVTRILTPGVVRREELFSIRRSLIRDRLSRSRSERNLAWMGFCQPLCIRLVGGGFLELRRFYSAAKMVG